MIIRSRDSLNIVILGASITSSRATGHATVYRALVKALAGRGHRPLFLERDVPEYAVGRDLPPASGGPVRLYDTLEDLTLEYDRHVREADLVLVGSHVPHGHAVGRWVNDTAEGLTAFIDLDTPATLEAVSQQTCAYLDAELLQRFGVYLASAGGPWLERLRQEWQVPVAQTFYPCVDAETHYPGEMTKAWDLGFMGSRDAARRRGVERLLVEPARRWPEGTFVVAGEGYAELAEVWPDTIDGLNHVVPAEHPSFYHSQRFTLNLARPDAARGGYCPSVRLFEAAACGTPIISDWFEGLDHFLLPDREILIAEHADHVLAYLKETSDERRAELAAQARHRVLSEHSGEHRAAQLEQLVTAMQADSGRRLTPYFQRQNLS